MAEPFDVDRFLVGKPLAITPAGFEELRAHIAARIALFNTAPTESVLSALSEIAARMKPRAIAQGPSGTTQKATGVIQIRGTISQHAEADSSMAAVGGTSTDEIMAAFDAMIADETISKIVLELDSPGGSTYGVTELANRIMDARGTKPIVAFANSLAGSAAYWIGAAADRFIATPGAQVGSIGVFAMHQDISGAAEQAGVKTTFISAGKYKVAGNEWEPLDTATRDRVQSRVDEIYRQFVGDVARGRGTTAEDVINNYGEGDVLTARKARAAGMVDGLMTFDEVVSRNFRSRPVSANAAEESAEAFWEEPTASAAVDNEGINRLARMRLRRFQAATARQ